MLEATFVLAVYDNNACSLTQTIITCPEDETEAGVVLTWLSKTDKELYTIFTRDHKLSDLDVPTLQELMEWVYTISIIKIT